jgi:hypothetical protein
MRRCSCRGTDGGAFKGWRGCRGGESVVKGDASCDGVWLPVLVFMRLFGRFCRGLSHPFRPRNGHVQM